MKIFLVLKNQDDPKKCTALKLEKLKLAKKIIRIPATSLVLHPFTDNYLLHHDKTQIHSITGIDCSWTKAQDEFLTSFSGIVRKLPPLLAGNPVNYSKIGKLSTVEAISASLFLLGYWDLGEKLLNKFNWGHTFYDLNKSLLKDYSQASSNSEINQIASDYTLM